MISAREPPLSGKDVSLSLPDESVPGLAEIPTATSPEGFIMQQVSQLSSFPTLTLPHCL